MSKKDEKNEKKISNSGLLVACWCLALLLLVIVFFVRKDDIASNLKQTNFFERVGVTTPEFVKNHEEQEKSAPVNKSYEFDLMSGGSSREPEKSYEEVTGSETVKAYEEEKKLEEIKKEQHLPEASAESDKAEKEVQIKKEVQKEPVKTESKPVVSTRDVSLYFVEIDSDGSIVRKNVKRTMNRSDSPLTDAINAVLSGPLPAEKSKNCKSLIPAGTRLLGASVKNGIATLNFSDEFEYAQNYGVEGYIASLMQIVYTATEFSTVSSVQILIDGEKKDYLGSEGQWIGSPLARSSFTR